MDKLGNNSGQMRRTNSTTEKAPPSNKLQRRKTTDNSMETEGTEYNFEKLKSFHIPRKKQQQYNKELLTELQLGSREYTHNIYPTIKTSFFHPQSSTKFKIDKVEMVYNSALNKEFVDKKKDMKEEGRTEKELLETFAYYYTSTRSQAEKICQNGLEIGNTVLSGLGKPEMGVYVCKHADIIRVGNFDFNEKGYIIVFKIVKGKTKVVAECKTATTTQEPTPLFDSHVSKLSQDVSKGTHTRLYQSLQYYLYEYGDIDMVKRPRQIVPHCVLHFRYNNHDQKHKRKDSISYPLEPYVDSNSINTDKSTDADNSTLYKLWRGMLLVKGGTSCNVALKSDLDTATNVSFLGRNLNVKSYLSLEQFSRFLPPTLLNKSTKKNNVIYRARHYNIFLLLPTDDSGAIKFRQLMAYLIQSDTVTVIPVQMSACIYLLPPSDLTMNRMGLAIPQLEKRSKDFMYCVIVTPKSLTTHINTVRVNNVVGIRKKRGQESKYPEEIQTKLNELNIDANTACNGMPAEELLKLSVALTMNINKTQSSEKLLTNHYKNSEDYFSTQLSLNRYLGKVGALFALTNQNRQERPKPVQPPVAKPPRKLQIPRNQPLGGIREQEATFSADDENSDEEMETVQPVAPQLKADKRKLPVDVPAEPTVKLFRPSFKPIEEVLSANVTRELMIHPDFVMSERFQKTHLIDRGPQFDDDDFDVKKENQLKVNFRQQVPFSTEKDCPYACDGDPEIKSMIRAIHGLWEETEESVNKRDKVLWVRQVLHIKHSDKNLNLFSSNTRKIETDDTARVASPVSGQGGMSGDSGFASSSTPNVGSNNQLLSDVANFLADMLKQDKDTNNAEENVYANADVISQVLAKAVDKNDLEGIARGKSENSDSTMSSMSMSESGESQGKEEKATGKPQDPRLTRGVHSHRLSLPNYRFPPSKKAALPRDAEVVLGPLIEIPRNPAPTRHNFMLPQSSHTPLQILSMKPPPATGVVTATRPIFSMTVGTPIPVITSRFNDNTVTPICPPTHGVFPNFGAPPLPEGVWKEGKVTLMMGPHMSGTTLTIPQFITQPQPLTLPGPPPTRPMTGLSVHPPLPGHQSITVTTTKSGHPPVTILSKGATTSTGKDLRNTNRPTMIGPPPQPLSTDVAIIRLLTNKLGLNPGTLETLITPQTMPRLSRDTTPSTGILRGTGRTPIGINKGPRITPKKDISVAELKRLLSDCQKHLGATTPDPASGSHPMKITRPVGTPATPHKGMGVTTTDDTKKTVTFTPTFSKNLSSFLRYGSQSSTLKLPTETFTVKVDFKTCKRSLVDGKNDKPMSNVSTNSSASNTQSEEKIVENDPKLYSEEKIESRKDVKNSTSDLLTVFTSTDIDRIKNLLHKNKEKRKKSGKPMVKEIQADVDCLLEKCVVKKPTNLSVNDTTPKEKLGAEEVKKNNSFKEEIIEKNLSSEKEIIKKNISSRKVIEKSQSEKAMVEKNLSSQKEVFEKSESSQKEFVEEKQPSTSEKSKPNLKSELEEVETMKEGFGNGDGVISEIQNILSTVGKGESVTGASADVLSTKLLELALQLRRPALNQLNRSTPAEESKKVAKKPEISTENAPQLSVNVVETTLLKEPSSARIKPTATVKSVVSPTQTVSGHQTLPPSCGDSIDTTRDTNTPTLDDTYDANHVDKIIPSRPSTPTLPKMTPTTQQKTEPKDKKEVKKSRDKKHHDNARSRDTKKMGQKHIVEVNNQRSSNKHDEKYREKRPSSQKHEKISSRAISRKEKSSPKKLPSRKSTKSTSSRSKTPEKKAPSVPLVRSQTPPFVLAEPEENVEPKHHYFHVFDPTGHHSCVAINEFLAERGGLKFDLEQISDKLKLFGGAYVDASKEVMDAILPPGNLWIVIRSEDLNLVSNIPYLPLLKCGGRYVQFICAYTELDVSMNRYVNIMSGDYGILVPISAKVILNNIMIFCELLRWMSKCGYCVNPDTCNKVNVWRVAIHQHVINQLQNASTNVFYPSVLQYHAKIISEIIEKNPNIVEVISSKTSNEEELSVAEVFDVTAGLQIDGIYSVKHAIVLTEESSEIERWSEIQKSGVVVTTTRRFVQVVAEEKSMKNDSRNPYSPLMRLYSIKNN